MDRGSIGVQAVVKICRKQKVQRQGLGIQQFRKCLLCKTQEPCLTLTIYIVKSCMVMCTCDSCAREAETGGIPGVW